MCDAQRSGGLKDFGSGGVAVMRTHCLRCAKLPSDCTICYDVCPVGALHECDNAPEANCKCIKCGLCFAACPLEALISKTTPTLKLNQSLVKAMSRTPQLLVSCKRSETLLASRAQSVDGSGGEGTVGNNSGKQTGGQVQAQVALQAFTALQASENLVVVSCIGSIATELWFTLLSEVLDPEQNELAVLLLPGQCDGCEVAANGAALKMIDSALCAGELWRGLPVELVDDLPTYQARVQRGITATLNSDAALGKREAVEQLFGGLKQSWQSAGSKQGRAVREIQAIRQRAGAIDKTRYGSILHTSSGDGHSMIQASRAKVTSRRHILLETIGTHPDLSTQVELNVSITDPKLCTLCSRCIDACPINARYKLEEQKPDGTNNNATISYATTNDVVCEGCTACVQVCPTGACGLASIRGNTLLLPASELDKEGDEST